MLTTEVVLIISTGAFLGGFISGLAGFGTGLVALGIWLHAAPPAVAASLSVICSVIAQSQTIGRIWHAIDFRHLWPMLVAGILGVPLGAAMLAHVDPVVFRLCVGLLLVAFSALMLAGRSCLAINWGGRPADTVVGLFGGVLGGLAGLSGPLPTIWATLRGWSKDQRRGVFQIFNLVTLGTALLVYVARGLIGREVLVLACAALPGTLSGAWLGAYASRRLSDHHFHQIVLTLLGASGVVLIWQSLKW